MIHILHVPDNLFTAFLLSQIILRMGTQMDENERVPPLGDSSDSDDNMPPPSNDIDDKSSQDTVSILHDLLNDDGISVGGV